MVADTRHYEELLLDAQEFANNRQWYRQRGIPYRRGYLLHGEHGCGKTYFTKVRAHPGRLSARSVTHGKSVSYGAFI